MGREPLARDFDLLRGLEVFISVAETGSMTTAAARMSITQSAISQQVKILETYFGAALFYRDIRPLRLTPAGLVLNNRASALLTTARELRSDVRHAAAGKLPHLRIAILSTFARQLAPEILRSVRDKRLSVDNLTIMRGMSINHAHDLANREIDVAWTSDALAQSTDLERTPLVRETFFVVTPRGFGRHAGDLRVLAAYLPFLRYSTRTRSGQKIETHLRRLRINFPNTPIFEASVDLIDAVGSGMGWSIITPSQLFDVLDANVSIEARQLPGPALTRTLSLVWRRGEMQDLMRELCAICATAMRERSAPRLLSAMPDVAAYFEILALP